MKFLLAIQLLEIFFNSPKQFLKLELNKFQTAKEIFYNLHLPFLIHYPILIFLSPYLWYLYFAKNVTLDKILFHYFVLPLVIYSFMILFLVFFDKLQIYSQTPTIGLKKNYFCLYSSLILSASIIFFAMYPFLGFIFLIVSFFYSSSIGVYLWSKYLKKTIKQLFLEILLSLCLFLFVILLVVLFFNLWNSYQELKRFGIL